MTKNRHILRDHGSNLVRGLTSLDPSSRQIQPRVLILHNSYPFLFLYYPSIYGTFPLTMRPLFLTRFTRSANPPIHQSVSSPFSILRSGLGVPFLCSLIRIKCVNHDDDSRVQNFSLRQPRKKVLEKNWPLSSFDSKRFLLTTQHFLFWRTVGGSEHPKYSNQ